MSYRVQLALALSIGLAALPSIGGASSCRAGGLVLGSHSLGDPDVPVSGTEPHRAGNPDQSSTHGARSDGPSGNVPIWARVRSPQGALPGSQVLRRVRPSYFAGDPGVPGNSPGDPDQPDGTWKLLHWLGLR